MEKSNRHLLVVRLREPYPRSPGTITPLRDPWFSHPSPGEMVISVSSTGDLVEDRQYWLDKLMNGDVAGYPIEVPGDTIYETEISGLVNFYHVFDTDLDESMKLTLTDRNQHYWIEGIRFPDPEFETVEAEQENYRKVVEFNNQKAGELWTPADYARLHTVAGFRSGSVQGRAEPVGSEEMRSGSMSPEVGGQ